MKGTTIKRGGTWSAVLSLGKDENGKRLRRWRSGFRTKKEAEAELAKLLVQVNEGGYVEPVKATVTQFARQWLDSIKPTVRPSTWETYRIMTESHIIPRLGHAQVARLTAGQLNSVYSDLLEGGRRDGKGGLSARSVRYVASTIKKMLGDAVRRGELARNVALGADAPAERPQREMRTWTGPQIKQFLDHVAGDRLAALYTVLATTGCRRGEALALKWGDVDLDGGRIAIRRNLVVVDYKVQWSEPKTKAGRRAISIDSHTIEALRQHRLRQLAERLQTGQGQLTDDALVFADLDGSPLHPGGFSQAFERHVRTSGLPKLTVHGLRHSHASIMLERGVHPKVVQERLGHANIAMTLDLYSHVAAGLQQEAAQQAAAAVFAS